MSGVALLYLFRGQGKGKFKAGEILKDKDSKPIRVGYASTVFASDWRGTGKLDLLIWFGALTAVNMQTAYLSPPVAMSAYYLRNVVPQWSLATIYKGMADYMIIQVLVIIVLLIWPQIALWLPQVVR